MRLFSAWLVLCPLLLAQAPHVTDTKLVNAGKGQEWLRQINGRWWSQDNREVYPPGKDGVFWELDSKPGVVQFFHHRPFQLSRAASLRLWMKKDEVQAALGAPNRIFGKDDHAFWYYYAANGTKLQVRFMDGTLGEAKYYAIGEKSWTVASIEREMNGRDIYKLMQERAVQKSEERRAKWKEEIGVKQAARSEALQRSGRPFGSGARSVQPSMVAVESGNVAAAAEPAPPAQKRIISAEALAAVGPGTTREDVLTRLGEPSSRFAITDDDGVRESFTYDLNSGEAVVIRLAGGIVVKVR